MRLTLEQQKSLGSVQRASGFQHYLALLQAEQEIIMKGLMTASGDNLYRLQGKATLLDELIKALTT